MSAVTGLTHPVARRRLQFTWSQSELARRAGIPRTTVSAIERGRLTPSVATALTLGRTLQCSVEELFEPGSAPGEISGPEWAFQPRVRPCRYWEAEVGGRRWFFPTESLSMNVVAHDGVWHSGPGRDAGPLLSSRTLVVACCDPAAGLLAAEYGRSTGFRMIVLSRGGREALELLQRGLVHAAGLHRATEDRPEANSEAARARLGDEFRLLRVVDWQEGIATPLESRTRSLQSIVRGARRWALREEGSAARECLDGLLPARPGRTVYSHAAVAEAVRGGWADAGVCVQLSAEEAGLRFVPVRVEAFDFCLRSATLHDPRIQALIRVLRTRSFRRQMGELPGYDTRLTGTLLAPGCQHNP